MPASASEPDSTRHCSGASTSIHTTGAPASSATWMVWPVPPTRARVVPSQIAMTRSLCSTITRLVSATRSDTSASNTCALRRSAGSSSFSSNSAAMASSWSASSNSRALDARRWKDSTRSRASPRTVCNCPAPPCSSALASFASAGCALIAAYSVKPKGKGAISSQPRASAAAATIWSAPSASRLCRRVGAGVIPGRPASAATKPSMRSRMRASVASMRERRAANSGLSWRWPVTPTQRRGFNATGTDPRAGWRWQGPRPRW
jgi:hypothetical protein